MKKLIVFMFSVVLFGSYAQQFNIDNVGQKIYCVIENQNNEFITVGQGNSGLLVSKYDFQGTNIWSKIFDDNGFSQNATGYSISSTSDGGYIVFGTS